MRASLFSKGCCCSLALAVVLAMASQASAQLVVSQVYGDTAAAGPNGDYVEIFNRSCASVNLDGYSVQVATATGTAWVVVALPNFTLQPGQYYLIKLVSNAAGTVILTPDLIGPATGNLTLTSGKVAIVRGDVALPAAACPVSANIVDFVRYASVAPVVCNESSKNTTGTTAGNGIIRAGDGCIDTNNNDADFSVAVPAFRNSTSTLNPCAGVDPDYGSCILPAGTCAIMTEAECDSAVGLFGGVCSNCPVDGRCCSVDGLTCTQVIQSACQAPDTWSPGSCNISYLVNTECPPNFTDISESGTELLGWTSVDDSAISVTLPFTFKFYGVDRTSISVGTNGYIVFLPPAGGAAGGIPADSGLGGTQQNNSAYVYGEDLQLRGTGADPIGSVKHQVFGTSPNQVFIVQWTNVDLFSPTQPDGQRNTFQIKLYESSGVVEMQYLSLNLTGLSPIPADVVIGVRQSLANYTEVSESVVGTGPKALIFAPTGGCSSLVVAGSCCVPNQPCSVLPESDCQLSCGIYLGDGTNCTTTPCANEACCLPQGGCQDVLTAVCNTLGGAPQGPGSTCAGVNCPPAGRCCTATGACSVTLQATCNVAGSTWVQGEDCTTLPCVLGACCAADGSCSQLTEAGCTAANGISWTASTPCSPNLCRGRCCDAGGGCALTYPPGTTGATSCEAPSVFGGLGTTCEAFTEYGNPNPATVVIPTTGTGPGASVPSIINVPDNFSIVDVDVRVKIQHTFRGDLVVCLTGPGGSPVVRFSPGTDCAPTVITGGECGLEDNFNVIWDDEGSPINCTSVNLSNLANQPDRVVPNQPLSAFDGLPSLGDWTLTVFDDQAGDTGTLLEWSLLLDTGSPCEPPSGCTCFGDMNGSGGVNGADVNLFAQCVASGGAGCPCGDMNHVGGVTADDVPLFVAALLSGNCGAP